MYDVCVCVCVRMCSVCAWVMGKRVYVYMYEHRGGFILPTSGKMIRPIGMRSRVDTVSVIPISLRLNPRPPTNQRTPMQMLVEPYCIVSVYRDEVMF